MWPASAVMPGVMELWCDANAGVQTCSSLHGSAVIHWHSLISMVREGGKRKGGREGGREGGRGGRKAARQGGSEAGRDGNGAMEGDREGGRHAGREGGKEGVMERPAGRWAWRYLLERMELNVLCWGGC